MQHVERAMVIVVGNVNNVAVRGIDHERNIAAGSLLSQHAVEIEFSVLRYAYSSLAISRIYQVSKRFRAGAALVVAHDHDVRRPFAALIVEGTPRVIDGIRSAVRVNRRPHGWPILAGGCARLYTDTFKVGVCGTAVERLIYCGRTAARTEIVVPDVDSILTFICTARHRRYLHIRLVHILAVNQYFHRRGAGKVLSTQNVQARRA